MENYGLLMQRVMRYYVSILSKSGLFVLAFGISLFACKARKVAAPTVSTQVSDTMNLVGPSDTSRQNVIAIQEFYSRSCGACHVPYSPQKYNQEEWKYHLNRMQKRAMISDKNKEDLYVYLTKSK